MFIYIHIFLTTIIISMFTIAVTSTIFVRRGSAARMNVAPLSLVITMTWSAPAERLKYGAACTTWSMSARRKATPLAELQRKLETHANSLLREQGHNELILEEIEKARVDTARPEPILAP